MITTNKIHITQRQHGIETPHARAANYQGELRTSSSNDGTNGLSSRSRNDWSREDEMDALAGRMSSFFLSESSQAAFKVDKSGKRKQKQTRFS
jgi:hypothetical protein